MNSRAIRNAAPARLGTEPWRSQTMQPALLAIVSWIDRLLRLLHPVTRVRRLPVRARGLW